MYRVLITVIACACFSAEAKCVESSHLVKGVIVDEAGKPIPSATVAVTWKEFDGPHSRSAASSADGTYNVEVGFYPFSRRLPLGGDVCERRLESANIEVAARGRKSERGVVKFDNGQAVANFALHSQ
jgi:hypothetical protein